ncbi:MAG: PD-(D/E)XK nuclease family protein [Methylococcales bacterium]|nr:PD-(D/E)XK nuclease family protein [Methylococcales bacterium]
MTRPNLFNFATSELSQDAFIAWLLTWANKEYADIDKNLHGCAVEFVRELLGKTDYDVEIVKVKTQWNHTDVIAEVNDDFFILIEDKTGTSEHSNQLKRYLELAKNYCKDKNMNVAPVYYKMEEQSNLSKVIEAGYSVFTREKMLAVISSNESITNNIFCDYRDYLQELDNKINGFKTAQIDKWGWYQWTGFFSAIQKELDGNWDYVANPSGGFIGFWWHWIHKTLDEKGFHLYLQLEASKFVFKVEVNEHRENCAKLREHCRKTLFEVAKEQNIKIEKYGRTGAYMGIAKLADNSDYRITKTDGTIDLPATIGNLKKMEQLLNAVAEKL